MSALLERGGAAPAGWPADLEARAGHLAEHLGGQARTVAAVQGPGGTGKTVLLRAVARACQEGGLTVTDVRTPSEPTTNPVVVVDDAHRLTAEELRRLTDVVRGPRARVLVAYRPWPRPPGLVQAVQEMGAERRVLFLGHADAETVGRWATAALGRPAPAALVRFVLDQTGGVPSLVQQLLHALVPALRGLTAEGVAARLATGPVSRPELPAEVLDQVRAALALLDDDARDVLAAAAAGAPLEAELLAELLDASPRHAADAVSRARASAFLLPEGTVVPVVAAVLRSAVPQEVTQGLRRRLLGLLLDRGEEPVALARALAADGVHDPRAGALLTRSGTGALTSDPARAAALLDEAVRTGVAPAELHGRRAQAAALAGDFDAALLRADAALRDEAAPDRARAAGVAGAVLAQRGLLTRSAELYRLAGPERAGSRALVLLAAGARAEAEAALAGGSCSDPSLLAGAEWLTAQGVLASLRPGVSAPEATAAALSALTRAAGMVEPVGATVLLPESPSVLAALVALHNGQLGIAESGLRRALRTGIGGPALRSRHLLLLAWAAMLRGRVQVATGHLDRAIADGDRGLEPRDELFRWTLEVGLARRRSDSLALVAAWERAREAVLRYPVDLFSLLPLGELVVAAARLREEAALAPHRSAAAELLARLGNPPLWTTPLQWAGVQAAILSGDPAALGPHATALVTAARTHPFAAILATAGRSWLRVLGDDIDTQAVLVAAEGLGAVGLAWDGSRLAGQAAARAADARDRSALLQCARTLAEGDSGEPPPTGSTASVPRAEPEAAGVLSQREREVAELLMAGQTYREVGSRLFISAKTVEHHVARMRQRLGASTRSDLLARLRSELAQGDVLERPPFRGPR